jgi:hypothetical protein
VASLSLVSAQVVVSERDDDATPSGLWKRRPRSTLRWRRISGSDSVAAVVTWLIGTPLALLVVHVANRNPFTVGGSVMPIGVGGVVAAVLICAVLRNRSSRLIGIAVGAFAAWIAFTMGTALHGTPFGYGELSGDQGRLVASATKYMTTWRATDAFIPHLTTEYPPLYPWLVGHVAEVLNRPAWRLFGEAQIILMSGSLVISYMFWRRLVGPATSFVLVAVAPAVYADASKGYEFVTLVVIIPWALATFAGLARDRGGMHWLPAGIVGGLIVVTYSAYLVFALLALLAMVALGLRDRTRRRGYLMHLLGVVATAFVVASWYVIPYFLASLTTGGNRISDLFLAPELVTAPLPLVSATPLGVLQIIGLFGVVWYRRSAWWGQPMLLLGLSAFAYRVLFLLNTVHNNHTGYAEYTVRLSDLVLATAGVLTVSQAWPALRERLGAPLGRQRELALVAAVVLVSWASVQSWEALMPGPRGVADVAAGCSPACPPAGAANLATRAQIEPLPDGRLPRYAPADMKIRSFPTTAVQHAIESTLGPDPRALMLSYDQRLFEFLPYNAYSSPNRLSANTFARWDDRDAALKRLAAVINPEAFATASTATAFGRIDVFVLKRGGGTWNWSNVAFSPASFGRDHFHVTKLAGGTVVVVRYR